MEAPGRASVNLPSAAPTPLFGECAAGRRSRSPGRTGTHFLALTISKGARPHARVAVYGPRWPPGTRRDLGAISILDDSEERNRDLYEIA
eukprot:scaffold357_cov66-Phaeocystis_antarctica.AAC.2